MEEKPERRPFLLSKAWFQAVIIVMLVGFTILGILAYRTYTEGAPVPVKVFDSNGELLFDGDDISAGQQVFLHNGLMEYGSIFGHGAYLGPDYTADYLRRSSNIAIEFNGGPPVDEDGMEIEDSDPDPNPAGDAARQQTIDDFRANQFDEESGELVFTESQTAAFEALIPYYTRVFSADNTKDGLRKKAIDDPEDLRNLTAFFAWASWATAA